MTAPVNLDQMGSEAALWGPRLCRMSEQLLHFGDPAGAVAGAVRFWWRCICLSLAKLWPPLVVVPPL